MIRINTLNRCGETLTIELQQLAPSIQSTLESWGLEAWVDD